jgi:hypothetical protein
MPTLDMTGPFTLTNASINAQVTRATYGNYALGYVKNGDFYVQYVGRSDSNVHGRLKQHVGSYRHFMFSYATSPRAAFLTECRNFHDFGETEGLDNEIHPRRPDDTSWKCPVCDIFN